MINILLIEDDLDIGELIQYSIEKSNIGPNIKVYFVKNANDALLLLEEIYFDLIILDLMLPGLKGNDFLRITKNNKKSKDIPILVISARNLEKDVIDTIKAGAEDYLIKPFSMEMLNVKIESILRRNISKNQEIKSYEYKDILLDIENYKVFLNNAEIKLSLKETELLKLLMQKPGKVFSKNKILNTIWGLESESFTRTVDSHISSLKKKLGEYGDIIKSIPKEGFYID